MHWESRALQPRVWFASAHKEYKENALLSDTCDAVNSSTSCTKTRVVIMVAALSLTLLICQEPC